MGEQNNMSIKIYCKHCDREIKDGEEFFEDCPGQTFCKDCVKENTITYYSVGSEVIGSDEEVGVYYNYNQLKEEIEHKIKLCDEWIEVYENDNTENGKFTLEFYKEKKRLFQESLKESFG